MQLDSNAQQFPIVPGASDAQQPGSLAPGGVRDQPPPVPAAAQGMPVPTQPPGAQYAVPPAAPPATPPAPATPDSSTLDAQIAADEATISTLQDQLSELQQKLEQVKQHKASATAFNTEIKSSDSALKQAQNKAAAERNAAQPVVNQLPVFAGRLSDEFVHIVDAAVAAVEAESAARRNAVQTLQADVAARAGAEVNASAEATHAREALADAKRALADHVKAIETQTARVKSLKDAATDADTKGQINSAYILTKDLETALASLDYLLDSTRISQLLQQLRTAWDTEAIKVAAASNATAATKKAKDALKDAHEALTAYDKDRRKHIDQHIAQTVSSSTTTGEVR
jgi:hypothetical protein